MSERGVIVTGGASGIGAAIARRLAADGYTVAVLDQRALEGSDSVAAYQVDVTEYEAVRQAVDDFAGRLGSLHGLVNNAGWDRAQRFVDTTPQLWDTILNINLRGPMNVTHAVLQHLVPAGAGRVVSIASDAGRVGSSGEAVYSAAKGGTVALMKTLAREHARQGITFNSVCPGPTQTPLFEQLDETGKLAVALERAIPMRRLGQPDDYPGIVSFLLGDDAAFITGQTISVSGGLTMNG
tara:strand:- start:11240 stop:11956 length:717 start_codon:yes stop_codon:yes gene_type:complete